MGRAHGCRSWCHIPVRRPGLLDYPGKIVENGGDIYIKSNRDRIIGVYAGESPLSGKVGIKIRAGDCPMGVCTSSGKVGHSLSFGKADAAVILAPNTILADAVATATCNLVKAADHIQDAVDFAKGIDGVAGVVVIMEDRLGAGERLNWSVCRINPDRVNQILSVG